ncbi:TonB-dependent receptor [Jiulongibacter sediminis]|jgi:TonB-linked SusC/RagA family outer membrane protein|uniref:SusC/RagA family TonB-linked outer membrane protein n=1 Tax=Jiulongibacter sediminis TaxID=1605367 RepID=UPI0026F2D91D|nr:TonB-dependent receptor [Jiulongibacter sediminis]
MKFNSIRNVSRIIGVLALIFCIATQSMAQGRLVSGVVTSSEDNELLPGVSITLKGTAIGTTTDVNGKYNINVPENATLTFSFIGFVSQEVNVGNQSNINISMVSDETNLEEVIVVGYGTLKKSHLTGAVAKIEGGNIAAIQANRVDDALAGKLSGVLIQNQSGEPGADPKIQIRAAASLSGDSNPLIVVDGFPISGSLATINPNDIASLEVLKDAASAAIYGSRGANGVILVTTKKGNSGKANFSYNGYTSISNKYVKDIAMLKTASEWADELMTDKYDLSDVNPQLLDYRLNAYRNAPDVVSVEDWLFRTGSSNSHDLSVSGGSENVKAFASLGYINTQGIAMKQGFERYNTRLNVDANLSKRLKTGLSFNGSFSNREILPWDMRDLLRAYSISPIYHTAESIKFVQELDAQRQALANAGLTIANLGRSFDQDRRGNLGNQSIYTLQPGDVAHDWHYGRNQNGIGGSGDQGPAAKLDNSTQTERTFFGNMNAYLQFSLLEGLNLKTVLGADMNDGQAYYYSGVLTDGTHRFNRTALDQTSVNRTSVLSETTLNYARTIGKNDISAVGGLEFQNFYIKGTSISGTNVPVDLPLNYSFLSPADINTRLRDETVSRQSVFGRVTYAFDDRYLGSFSLRRDGDSRFGVNNRFEVFPAFSLGWNVHNEAFYKSNLLTDLKLRFSRGSLGTTSFLGSYSALSLLQAQPTIFGTGFLIPNNVANPDLTWQSNTETNLGLNLGFLRNRFTLGVDYYTSNIKDMLINQSVSEVLGTPSIVLNRGDIKSSGVEVELGANLISKADFKWKASGNISSVNTEITSLGDLQSLPYVVYGGPSGRGPQFRNYVGGEIGEMWGYETLGQVESIYIADPSRNIGFSSSEYYVKDQNGDGKIDPENDYVKLGSNIPDFYWGFNSSLNYKNFDLSLQFQGSQGAEVYNIDPIYWESQFGGRLKASFDVENDGIADHNGQFYQQTRNAHGSMIQDASYIALRNMTLGYNLNPTVTSKIGIGSARVYVAATNLWYKMAKNYTSFNPEGIEITNSGYLGPTTYGYQEGASPIVRSFTLGLNINF